MIIYAETKSAFLRDVEQNRLRAKLVDSFRAMTGGVPADSRVWADEYTRFSVTLAKACIDDDVQVALEYHLTAAGRFRIDALLAGNDGQRDNGLIVELKAWDKADATDIEGMVYAPVGGGKLTEHPSLQARKYKGLILRFNQDVVDRGVGLDPVAYLFNLHRRNPEPLEDARYQGVLNDATLFLADDTEKLRQRIEKIVPKKAKQDLLFILERGRLRPADGLIDRVSSMLEGNEEFVLMDDQNVAFQVIKHHLLPTMAKPGRQVFIVEGGPGTGKSVIAVRLLSEVLKQKLMGFFVAPNRAFRETLVEYLAKGNKGYREDGQALFQSSWSFHEADYDKDQRFDVLIVDEAHRLKNAGHMYKGKNMVEDMVRAAKISVFFVDDTQRVQWSDIGSVSEIQRVAAAYGAYCHAPIKLTAQFRCNGSDSYLNWLDDTLQIRETAEFDTWAGGQYEFKVFNSATELYQTLVQRNGSNKARLVAGYSWEWPSEGRRRGATTTHVNADGLALPWNFEGENWATSKDGIGQVGCVHTCQGLEFDWLGVLIGEDLVYRDGQVLGDPEKRARTDASLKGWKKDLRAAKGSPDATKAVLDRVDLIIKNTYKVLLSRGRRGCFVWCADPALRSYLKERLNLVLRHSEDLRPEPTGEVVHPLASRPSHPFKELGAREVEPYGNALPLVSLKFAAGAFSQSQVFDSDEVVWVEPPDFVRPCEGLFIAQVLGESMNRRIPNGAWCLFRMHPDGTRNGKVVVAQHHSIADAETGGQYTVKVYRSDKVEDPEMGWRHARITLSPDSDDPAFRSMVFEGEDSGISVVAELVSVLDGWV